MDHGLATRELHRVFLLPFPVPASGPLDLLQGPADNYNWGIIRALYPAELKWDDFPTASAVKKNILLLGQLFFGFPALEIDLLQFTAFHPP